MPNLYEKIISNFSDMRALVIGDIMLDSYYRGKAERICREAPVPIVNIDESEDSPGGAGNTALNLAALGANVDLVSVCGEDAEAELLLRNFREHGVTTDGIIQLKERKTLAKKRVMAHSQLLVRYDYGSTIPIHEETERKITAYLKEIMPHVDVVVISDYEYGIMTPNIIEALTDLTNIFPRPVIIDAKSLHRYKGMRITAVKPNYSEAVKILGLEKKEGAARVSQIANEGFKILETQDIQIAAITLDTEGAVIFEKGRKLFRTYTKPSENAKAAGAGDTFVSAMSLSLGLKSDTQTAMEIAAAAASTVTLKEGTSVCSQRELLAHFTHSGKVVSSLAELDEVCEKLRSEGKKIVFTNGFFDLLHSGHIEFLQEAKKAGDILLVAVNTDESIKRLRGNAYPFNPLPDRIKILSALSMVDYIVSFSENTALRLIKDIKPDIYVKGGTYTKATLIELHAVELLGGVVEILPYYNPHASDYQQMEPAEEIRQYSVYL